MESLEVMYRIEPFRFHQRPAQCKRLRRLGLSPQVLSAVSCGAISCKGGWTGPALRFLKLCAGSGNTAACKAVGSADRWIASLEERLSRVEQLLAGLV